MGEPPASRADDVPAARVLAAAGLPFVLHEHAPVMGAADHALSGLDLHSSMKTLSFVLADDSVVLVGIPGPAKLSYGALARALGVPRSQVRGAPPQVIEALGMQPGGVCPFASDPAVRIVLDQAVLDMPVIYCGSGRPDVTVEITPDVLLRACPGADVADLS